MEKKKRFILPLKENNGSDYSPPIWSRLYLCRVLDFHIGNKVRWFMCFCFFFVSSSWEMSRTHIPFLKQTGGGGGGGAFFIFRYGSVLE
jgi:hypothetical protein